MARRRRVEVVADQIAHVLNEGPTRVYSAASLNSLLKENRDRWQLPKSLGFAEFISFLQESGRLRSIRLSADIGQDVTRYVCEGVSPYAIALSLRPTAYLSHGTAAFLHGLTGQFPKVIYVNKEQSPKPPPRGGLTQEAIDRAFKGRQRASNYVFHFDIFRAVLLSGKHTGSLGVEDIPTPAGELLPATGLARTLIDITVRPTYAGGVEEVLNCFRRAREQEMLDVGVLLGTLNRLNYVYPYHQALGFYMERAGFNSEHLDPLRLLGLKYNFYLAYGLKGLVYNEDWRLYHPRGL
jgi:hypothetical protein